MLAQCLMMNQEINEVLVEIKHGAVELIIAGQNPAAILYTGSWCYGNKTDLSVTI